MITVATFLVGAILFQTPSLDSASPKERQAAIEQLAVGGNASAIPALAAALKKESRSDIRAVIVVGLARIHDPAAIPVFAETLRADLNKDVRLQVIDSIQRFYIPIDEAGPIRTIFNRVKSAFAAEDRPLAGDEVQVSPQVKEALATAMQKDFNDEVRAAAARALGSLRANDQVPVLVTALEDPQQVEHGSVRLEVVQSLGVIRDSAAGPALQRALRDRDKRIIQQAVISLGLVGYKEARTDLENLFRMDGDRNIRRSALDSLALLRDPGSRTLFESLMGDPDDHSREIAAEGIARLGVDGTKLAELKSRYDQEKKLNVRVALAFAMASGGENNSINDIANALDSGQAYQAEVYLYELGKYADKLSELHRYLRSSNPRVRARMARVLGNIGDPVSRAEIQPLTNDNNIDVAREAVAALRRLNAR